MITNESFSFSGLEPIDVNAPQYLAAQGWRASSTRGSEGSRKLVLDEYNANGPGINGLSIYCRQTTTAELVFCGNLTDGVGANLFLDFLVASNTTGKILVRNECASGSHGVVVRALEAGNVRLYDDTRGAWVLADEGNGGLPIPSLRPGMGVLIEWFTSRGGLHPDDHDPNLLRAHIRYSYSQGATAVQPTSVTSEGQTVYAHAQARVTNLTVTPSVGITTATFVMPPGIEGRRLLLRHTSGDPVTLSFATMSGEGGVGALPSTLLVSPGDVFNFLYSGFSWYPEF